MLWSLSPTLEHFAYVKYWTYFVYKNHIFRLDSFKHTGVSTIDFGSFFIWTYFLKQEKDYSLYINSGEKE